MAETNSLTDTFQPSVDHPLDANIMEDGTSLTHPGDINDQENDQQLKPTTHSSDEKTVLLQFFTAAKEGNMKKVQQCLKQVSNINQLDSGGSTALHLAVKSGNAEMVLLLLSSGADIETKNRRNQTSFHLAAKAGSKQLISLLQNSGANINAQDRYEMTSLSYAARSISPKVVTLLLKYGINMYAENYSQQTALHYAVRSGNPKVVSLLLTYGAYIHAKNYSQQVVLHHAVKLGNPKVVSLLLKYGIDVHAKDGAQRTALHCAAKSGSLEVVSLLLEHGVDIHAKDDDDQTALHYAVQSGNPRVVSLLLKSGAKVNATAFNESTDLQLALASGNEAVALALLDGGARADVLDNKQSPLRIASRHSFSRLMPALVRNGADINEQFQNGSTVLLEAAESGDKDLVSALLEQGANMEIADNNGLTPLFVASNNGYLGVMSLLLINGANKHTTDQHLWTVLHRAAERGDLNVASTLLEGGFDTEVKNGEGDTALHIAAQFNHLSIVIELCQHNANINATDHHGRTVLHRAVCFGRKEIVSYLMDSGAQLGNSDNDIDALLYVAAQAGQAEIAEVVLSSRFYITKTVLDSRQFSLLRAAECGHTEVVDVLLQHGVNIESTDEKGWTALHKACYASKMDTVRTLIQQGANKEAKEMENGRTSLFLAEKDPKIILLLIAEGADIEARNDDGATALHYYASIGQVDTIHLLLNYGCNIESCDYRERTALHYAAKHNQAEIMKILLDNGLDPYIENRENCTAFHLAVQNGNEEVMKVLLNNGFNVDTKAGRNNETPLLCAVDSMSLRATEFLLAHGASINNIDMWDRTSLHYAVEKDAPEIVELLLNRGVAVNALSSAGKSALDYAIEDNNLPIVAMLVRSGASIMKSVPPKEGRLAQYLTRVVSPIEQTSANELCIASTPIRHEEEDMSLAALKVHEILIILNDKDQVHTTAVPQIGYFFRQQYNSTSLPWWKQLRLGDWQDKNTTEQSSAYPIYGSTAEGHIVHPKELKSVLGSSTENWAMRVIACLLKTEEIRLYANDRIFALKQNTHTYEVSPKWAFHFDKMKGIIRQPGVLIVQIPQKRTRHSVHDWFDHNNALLRFINAIYVCRKVSGGVDQDAFSEVLGGQEQRLSTQLHATLIAALGIASIIGGPHILHRIVDAVLKCGPDYAPPAPAWPWKDWQALDRVRCTCEFNITHGPLTPVAAAKAIGINVWKERKSSILPRVWDLTKDQIVQDIDVTDVMFITHRWNDDEIVYKDVATPTFWSPKKLSRQSPKLKRIRDTLRLYTQYVWLDTICIDKSNLSEFDETIRSMYTWYGNCRAVVLDSCTTLDQWKSRGWCLQEGAAAGTLYGMSEGKLVSIQTLAKAQNVYLCTLDLSLYYQRGNAVEILSRMDMRETTRIEDMAYALAGIFFIHITLAYGEKERARQRLLQELASQKGDLSFFSFPTTEKNAGSHLPTRWRDTFKIAHCVVPSTPTQVSHLGLTIEALMFDREDAMKVLAALNELELLKTCKGRYVGLKGLNNAAILLNDISANHAHIAIIHSIRSVVLLVQVFDSEFHTGRGAPIKCCTRTQCCQIEENEFQTLFNKFKSVKTERIWLGDKQSMGR